MWLSLFFLPITSLSFILTLYNNCKSQKKHTISVISISINYFSIILSCQLLPNALPSSYLLAGAVSAVTALAAVTAVPAAAAALAALVLVVGAVVPEGCGLFSATPLFFPLEVVLLGQMGQSFHYLSTILSYQLSINVVKSCQSLVYPIQTYSFDNIHINELPFYHPFLPVVAECLAIIHMPLVYVNGRSEIHLVKNIWNSDYCHLICHFRT